MKKFLIKYKLELTGLLLGAPAGWLFWYYVGCTSGHCAITSSPINSTLYGAAMGALLPGIFKQEQKTTKHKQDHEYRKSD